MADGQLPDHGAEPLLRSAQINRLSLGALQITWKRVRELVLHLREPRRKASGADFVPQAHKRVVKGFVKVDEMYKAGNLDPLRGILVLGRDFNGSVERDGAVFVEGVGSAGELASANSPRYHGQWTDLSWMKSSQYNLRRREVSMKSPVLYVSSSCIPSSWACVVASRR